MRAHERLPTSPDGEPLGQRTNSIRWLQKKILKKASLLPHEFTTRAEWETFRAKLRAELPTVIGVPELPPLKESLVRGRVQVGDDVLCERVDVYADEDYAIPVFVFSPLQARGRMPGLVWNPGWPQDKWDKSCLQLGVRLARQGFVVLILDHAPFGETAPYQDYDTVRMTLVMGMGHLLGISQLALRARETMRVGEYLRTRPDVRPVDRFPRRLRAVERNPPQAGHCLQSDKAGVGDRIVAQQQPRELFQRLEIDQALVGHLRLGEIENPQALQA